MTAWIYLEGSDGDNVFQMMQVASENEEPRLSSGAAPGDAFLMGDPNDGERWDLGGRKVATSMERRPRSQQASAKRWLPQERLLPMNGQLFDEGRVESLVVGAMPVCPPLNIRLQRQFAHRAMRARAASAPPRL